MRRALVLVLLLVSALCCAACLPGGRDNDLLPPAGWVPPPATATRRVPLRAPSITYGPGFGDWEETPDGNRWRWMGARGELRLPALAGARRLVRLVGWVPLDLMPGPAPRLRVVLDGRELDSFVLARSAVDRSYVVEGAPGPATLVVETSRVFTAPPDPRPLGMALTAVDWQSVPAPAP